MDRSDWASGRCLQLYTTNDIQKRDRQWWSSHNAWGILESCWFEVLILYRDYTVYYRRIMKNYKKLFHLISYLDFSDLHCTCSCLYLGSGLEDWDALPQDLHLLQLHLPLLCRCCSCVGLVHSTFCDLFREKRWGHPRMLEFWCIEPCWACELLLMACWPSFWFCCSLHFIPAHRIVRVAVVISCYFYFKCQSVFTSLGVVIVLNVSRCLLGLFIIFSPFCFRLRQSGLRTLADAYGLLAFRSW